MKALEVLKHYKKVTANMPHGMSTKRIHEAIAELEALQQPKSCESCKHRSFLDKTLTNKITNGFCMENGFFTKVGFCCNRYEAKEQ